MRLPPTMLILGLDVGSSSVKAALLRGGKIEGALTRATYPTNFNGPRAEVDPAKILKAITTAIKDLGPRARRADAIALSVMSPAWIAMDRRGKSLTPIITHQDRRSVTEAAELERRVGPARYLKIAGNRPFPGGISSSTTAWFAANHPEILRKADLIGHLNTFLHCELTGQRVIDPSNASFTGLYETVKLGGWSELICDAIGIRKHQLPDILESDQIGGNLNGDLGLPGGIPVMAGWIDTTGAIVLAGAKAGRLLNVSGSTDVLALCTNRPRPHPRLLTRALGAGRMWLSVGTIAAAGSALEWARRQLFAEMGEDRFYRLVRLCANGHSGGCRFEPYLAGDRTSMEAKQGAFTNLTLATTREQMLAAVVDSLAEVSAARLKLLATRGVKIDHRVITSGGTARGLRNVLQRDWPGKWSFQYQDEASLRGLWHQRPH
jgi:xylulokinase